MSDAAAASDEPWVPEDSFAARLVLVRHQLNLTQKEAAERCDLDDGSWSNWERGVRPRDKTQVVQQIVDALGCDREWLAFGRDIKTRCYPETGEQQYLDLKYDPAPVDDAPTAVDRPAVAA